MERNIILANLASLTAEQLFGEIKGGNVTLDELKKTGNLDVTKRNKIIYWMNPFFSVVKITISLIPVQQKPGPSYYDWLPETG